MGTRWSSAPRLISRGTLIWVVKNMCCLLSSQTRNLTCLINRPQVYTVTCIHIPLIVNSPTASLSSMCALSLSRYSEQSGKWTAQLLMLVSNPCVLAACLPQYPIATATGHRRLGSRIWKMSLDSTMSALRRCSSGATTHTPIPPNTPSSQWEMILDLASESVGEVFSVYPNTSIMNSILNQFG